MDIKEAFNKIVFRIDELTEELNKHGEIIVEQRERIEILEIACRILIKKDRDKISRDMLSIFNEPKRKDT